MADIGISWGVHSEFVEEENFLISIGRHGVFCIHGVTAGNINSIEVVDTALNNIAL